MAHSTMGHSPRSTGAIDLPDTAQSPLKINKNASRLGKQSTKGGVINIMSPHSRLRTKTLSGRSPKIPLRTKIVPKTSSANGSAIAKPMANGETRSQSKISRLQPKNLLSLPERLDMLELYRVHLERYNKQMNRENLVKWGAANFLIHSSWLLGKPVGGWSL